MELWCIISVALYVGLSLGVLSYNLGTGNITCATAYQGARSFSKWGNLQVTLKEGALCILASTVFLIVILTYPLTLLNAFILTKLYSIFK